MTRLLLAGCGNMGYAMLTAWIENERISAADIAVVEPVDALRDRAGKIGVSVFQDVSEVPADFDPEIILFAVKPQIVRDVVPAYRRFCERPVICVSIAAGTKIGIFEDLLGCDAAVIRCMPNTPAAIGKGMIVLVANGRAGPESRDSIQHLLSANGRVEWIDDEGLMDAVTAVSGSGPAYVFHFIECLTEAGKNAGLPDDTAAILAMQTVYGAASLAFESDDSPSTLREKVTSPNGTTAAALGIFMKNNQTEKLVTEAVKAARDRSIELS